MARAFSKYGFVPTNMVAIRKEKGSSKELPFCTTDGKGTKS
jgi:hypothetical protein